MFTIFMANVVFGRWEGKYVFWLSRTLPEDGEGHIVHEKLPLKEGEARGSVFTLLLC